MFVYVLSGVEAGCPLWRYTFSHVEKAFLFAKTQFFLRAWQKRGKHQQWEIKTLDRVYRIEKRKVARDGQY